MNPDWWWWSLSLALMLTGIAGTFIPILPGAPLVFAGMWLAAWIEDYQRIGWVALTVLGALTGLVLIIDVLAAMLGARRVGASRQALAGAAIGALLGMFFGLVGLMVAPFLGAVAGELIARGQLLPATRVGFATWLGLMVGALAKIAVVLAMLGVFVTSYLFH